jgi:putative hydrolase of the HAD superfamily
MKIKAVLFDLNGVLTKSDKANWKEVRFTAEILNIKPTKKHSTAWRKIYVPLSNGKMSLAQYHAKLERIFKAKLPKDFEEKFSSFEKAKERGIPKLLKTLKDRGYRLGVLTNYYQDWAARALKNTGITGYVDVLAVSSKLGARKPSKKAYTGALKLLRAEPEECLYVGDGLDDLEGAKKIGMKTLFIPDKEPKAPGHAKIMKLSEILKVLK